MNSARRILACAAIATALATPSFAGWCAQNFNAPAVKHISYSFEKTRPTTFLLELKVAGPGANATVASGPATISGSYRLEVTSGGSYTFTLHEHYKEGEENRVQSGDVLTVVQASRVNGSLLFDESVTADGPDMLDIVYPLTVPEGRQLTLSGLTEGGNNMFSITVGGTLILSQCELLAESLGGTISGTGNVQLNECRFRDSAPTTLGTLGSLSVMTCLFENPITFDAEEIDVADSVFTYDSLTSDGFAYGGSPVFRPTGECNIEGNEFRGGDLQLYNGTALTTLRDNAFCGSTLRVRGTAPTLPTVDGNGFYGGTIDVEDASITTFAVGGNYWGSSRGPLNPDSEATGWLSGAGSFCRFAGPHTAFLASGPSDRCSTVDDDRPLPYIHAQQWAWGQIALAPHRTDTTPRTGRPSLLCVDLICDAASVPGVAYTLKCNGQEYQPQGGFTVRRDYGPFRKFESPDADTRTLNFILPADLPAGSHAAELWADSTAAAGYGPSRLTGTKVMKVDDFILAVNPPYGRALKIGVVDVFIDVSGYNAKTYQGSTRFLRPSSTDRVIERMRQDIVSHWPLNDDPAELDIQKVGEYEFEGGKNVNWASQISTVAMMYQLAAELSDFLSEYNLTHSADPVDFLVAVVPGTSLGAENEGASMPGFRNVALVDEGAPGAAIHELGHCLGLYARVLTSEQYGQATGTDADGNRIIKGRGAYLHAMTAFNSSPVLPAAMPEKIRHFPEGTMIGVYDFMGARDPHWSVPSSLGRVMTSLAGRLGYRAGGSAPKAASAGDAKAAGTTRLLVRGLYQMNWNGSLGFWETSLQPESVSVAAVAGRGYATRLNNELWMSTRADFLNDRGQVVASQLCRDTDYGQPTNTWLPWMEVYEVPDSAVMCKVWQTTDSGSSLRLAAICPLRNAFTNTLTGSVETTADGQNLRLAWSGPTAAPGQARYDNRLYASTDGGTNWSLLGNGVLTNGMVLPAKAFPAGSSLAFRLVTSDGFREVMSPVVWLSPSPSPPTVEILAPRPGDQAATGVVWTLRATACDAGGVSVTGGQWTSSRDGALGVGPLLEGIVLSSGSHTIAYQYADVRGLASTASVSVVAGIGTAVDLAVGAAALTIVPDGADPAAGGGLRLVPAVTNTLALELRNQGVSNAASVGLYLTPPGGGEILLLSTNVAWGPFGTRLWAVDYLPTNRGTHLVRASVQPIGIADTNQANNQCLWAISNHPPLAYGRRIEVRANAMPLDLRVESADPEKDPLTYRVVTMPAHGVLTGSGPDYRYNSVAGYVGPDVFTYAASDGLVESAPGRLDLVVLPERRTPVVTSAGSVSGTQGDPFTHRITADYEPLVFGATSLPNGLYGDVASGVITGTPTVGGTFTPTISAGNLAGTGYGALTISLASGMPQITSAPGAAVRSGQPFNYQIAATHSPTGYSAVGLPSGLACHPASGAVTGTTTAVGSHSVTLRASNVYGTGTLGLSLVVCAANATNDYFDLRALVTGTNVYVTGSTTGATREVGEPVHAGNPSLVGSLWWAWTAPKAGFVTVSTAGSGFDTTLAVYTGPAIHQLSAVASNENWRWGVTSLAYFQAVSGTTYYVAVDGWERGNVQLRVQYRSAPVITSPLNAYGVATRPFHYQIVAENNPTGYKSGTLPSGLSLDNVGGAVTGKPTVKTDQWVSLVASNRYGSDTQDIYVVIYSAQYPVFTNPCHAAAVAGQPFSFKVGASNALAGTYAAWPLPVSLEFDVNSGLISGTPWIGGIHNVALSVQNSQYEMASTNLILNVRLPYDDWKIYHFFGGELSDPLISGPDADPDGDGMPNSGEHMAGTDCRDEDDFLGLTGTNGVGMVGTSRVVRWMSVADHYYFVGVGTNLRSPFATISGTLPATPSVNVFTDAVQRTPPVFYRIELDP